MIYTISIDFIILYIDHNFSVFMSKHELLKDDRLDIIISEDDNRLISFFLSRDFSRYIWNILPSIYPCYFHVRIDLVKSHWILPGKNIAEYDLFHIIFEYIF